MNWFKQHIYDSGEKSEEKKPPAFVSPATPPAANAAPAFQSASVPGGTAPMVSHINQEMVADIQNVIERRPSAYRSLKENADAMAAAISDEHARTRAAFALLTKQGSSAPQVITSIDLHIRDIEGEKATVLAGGKQAVERKAGLLRQEAEQLLAENARDEQTIQQLEQQISTTRNRIMERAGQASAKAQEATTAEMEIQSKTQQFTVAADHVIHNLNMQKSSLASMLN